MEANGIEFMVSHHGHRTAGIAHVFHDVQRFPDPWAAVDEIAYENGHPAPGVFINPGDAPVPQLLQEPLQRIGVAVDVTNDVYVISHGNEFRVS